MSKFAFENPANGNVQKFEHPGAMVLFLGPIYFAIVQAWTPAAVCLVFNVFTGGLAWLVFPVLAERICRRYYGDLGWKEVPYPEPEQVRRDENATDIMLWAIGGCTVILLAFMGWMKWIL